MANMSHEIRTPLTAILGFTRILAARSDLEASEVAPVLRTVWRLG
jgi:signal transduction histidine kinase